MELHELVLNGNNETWVPWKGDVAVLLRYVSPEADRDIRKKALRPQWQGHQRMESEIDDVAIRNYYLEHVVKGIRGLTKDGQEFTPDAAFLRQLWDGNHEFGVFVVQASRAIENFIEKKSV